MNILVYIESRNGKIRSAGLEAVSAARKLADACEGEVNGLLIGDSLENIADEVDSYGLDRIMLAQHDDFKGYTPEGYREALVTAANECGAEVVIISGTALGRDLAPVVAARLGAAMIPDCTAIELEDEKLLTTRPVYAGRIMLTLATTAFPVVISVRPKAFMADQLEGKQPERVNLTVNLEGVIRTRLVETRFEAGEKLDVTEAEVIVTGGRGMKTSENFHLVEDLADKLGAAIGASRAVVDSGWRPHSEQIGQTGKVVSPTLYIACGISGAIQHLAGMSTSKVIVAINKDADAPIFKKADYGIVGDVNEVLPALIEAVKTID